MKKANVVETPLGSDITVKFGDIAVIYDFTHHAFCYSQG